MKDHDERSLVEHEHAAKRAVLNMVTMWNRTADASNANRIESIRTALEFGATWSELGAAMGISRQLAHRRFANGVRGTVAIKRKH